MGNENRNYSGHRGNTGNHATTLNERKFEKDFKEFKRRNQTGNPVMWDGPHSRENAINSTNEIRAFISEESGRNLE